jgi:uncharacterized protein (DUF983 family)
MSSPHPGRTTPPPDDAGRPSLPRARTLLARALRLRCPVCGGRPVLLGWFTVAPSCPVCGMHMDRDEPGYWVGSYTVNLVLTEGVFAVAFVGGMFLTWPGVPWTALTIVCLSLAILIPILVFPHSKLLYLAIDLAFRPPEPTDLATPHERGFTRRGSGP